MIYLCKPSYIFHFIAVDIMQLYLYPLKMHTETQILRHQQCLMTPTLPDVCEGYCIVSINIYRNQASIDLNIMMG